MGPNRTDVRLGPWLPLRLLLAAALANASGLPPLTAVSFATKRLVGYYDANSQLELHPSAIPGNLTHIVLTNGVKVDSSGVLHFRAKAHPAELELPALLQRLSVLPPKLVLSLRGQDGDTALDELAESSQVREDFATNLAQRLRDWGVDGLEVEWHAEDPQGGKAAAAPFDAMEQYHFALLCRDLSGALRAAGGKTLSVAVRPGRREFNSSDVVRYYVDWLTVRAYSMRSLGDPHHSSLADALAGLEEWTARGVPPRQLVLATALFARPGSALAAKQEGKPLPWRRLAGSAEHDAQDQRGDAFAERATGKVWWLPGLNTTRAKAQQVLAGGFAGLAFRDLHHDATAQGLSLVRAASDVLCVVRQQRNGFVLLQREVTRSRAEGVSESEEEEEGEL